MHRGMPVVAPIECGRQFSRRCRIRIAVQGMANVVRIFLVDARERKIRKPLSRFGVELTCILGGSTHREE